MNTFALEFEKICHRYGSIIALQDLSLTLDPSEVVCLLGPSGCGKSTALRIAAGLEKVQKGFVRLNGKPVSGPNFHLQAEERNIGLVFQDYALFPHLSVIDNVKFGLVNKKMGSVEEIAFNALKMVKMQKFADKFPHTLSGGEQQRVAIARALAPKPNTMLLDEPYSGLDARLREIIRDEVLHLLRNEQCATLMVTHDADEAMFMADKIVVMREGSVIQTGSPEELYFSPCNTFVAEVFGELNKLEGLMKHGKVLSPLIEFPAKNIESNNLLEIVIRPEALEISSAQRKAACFQARVIDSRLLGRISYIHLTPSNILNEGANEIHLHCKMPGRVLPKTGEIVNVNIDFDQTFIFEKEY